MANLPENYPTFKCKASWPATAKTILIVAKDEVQAKDRAWKQIAREMGGDSCLRVDVVGTV